MGADKEDNGLGADNEEGDNGLGTGKEDNGLGTGKEDNDLGADKGNGLDVDDSSGLGTDKGLEDSGVEDNGLGVVSEKDTIFLHTDIPFSHTNDVSLWDFCQTHTGRISPLSPFTPITPKYEHPGNSDTLSNI